MRISRPATLVLSILTIVLYLSSLASGLCADDSARSKRCYSRYLKYSEIAMQYQDALAAKLAERAFRCVTSGRLGGPNALAASRDIRDQIKALSRKIKALKRKAEKLMTTNVVQALRILDQVADLQLKLNRLKQKLEQGNCPANKTTVRLVFENNSDYQVGIYILDTTNLAHLLGSIPPVKIGTIPMSLAKVQQYSGSATSAKFVFYTRVNQKDIFVNASYSLKRLPKEKPCLAIVRWEMFNKTFPVPPSQYYVFGVNAGPNLYVGTEEALRVRTPYSFLNGGMDNVSKVTYNKLGGPYSTYEAAQQALCAGISQHVHWNLYAPCQERFMFRGSWYWGCEGSVRSAINSYCPQFK